MKLYKEENLLLKELLELNKQKQLTMEILIHILKMDKHILTLMVMVIYNILIKDKEILILPQM